MKKALLTLALVASTISSHSQGTINFFSSNPVYFPGGTVGVGAGFTVGLFLASDLNTPLGTTTFLTGGGEGYLEAVEVVVPGFATGSSTAQFKVRIWETGKTFATSTMVGESPTFTTGSLGGPVVGMPPALPPDANFPSFIHVPEPSSYAFAIAGLGALVMMRRRK